MSTYFFLDWVLIRCLPMVQSALRVLEQWEEWAIKVQIWLLKGYS